MSTKVFCVLALLAFAACSVPATIALAPKTTTAAPACDVGRIVDGDTVRMVCQNGISQNARLLGFDTPETYKPQCRAEAQLGAQATARLTQLVSDASDVSFGDVEAYDRYDRALVRLFVDGRDVGDILIAEGLARPYSGDRRMSWCA